MRGRQSRLHKFVARVSLRVKHFVAEKGRTGVVRTGDCSVRDLGRTRESFVCYEAVNVTLSARVNRLVAFEGIHVMLQREELFGHIIAIRFSSSKQPHQPSHK